VLVTPPAMLLGMSLTAVMTVAVAVVATATTVTLSNVAIPKDQNGDPIITVCVAACLTCLRSGCRCRCIVCGACNVWARECVVNTSVGSSTHRVLGAAVATAAIVVDGHTPQAAEVDGVNALMSGHTRVSELARYVPTQCMDGQSQARTFLHVQSG
jgi:hypothetical protein